MLVMEVLAHAMLVIILQCLKGSNQHIVYNVICQLYLRKLGKKQMFLWFGFSFLPPLFICAVIFPSGSDDKESACNEGDLSSIPGLGRFPGGGHGNPLQYSCWRIPMERGAWWATVHGVAKSRTRLSD